MRPTCTQCSHIYIHIYKRTYARMHVCMYTCSQCDLKNKCESLQRSSRSTLVQINRWKPLEIPIYFASRNIYYVPMHALLNVCIISFSPHIFRHASRAYLQLWTHVVVWFLSNTRTFTAHNISQCTHIHETHMKTHTNSAVISNTWATWLLVAKTNSGVLFPRKAFASPTKVTVSLSTVATLKLSSMVWLWVHVSNWMCVHAGVHTSRHECLFMQVCIHHDNHTALNSSKLSNMQ